MMTNPGDKSVQRTRLGMHIDLTGKTIPGHRRAEPADGVRQDELGALEETLQSVREAREKLWAKAREVLGSNLDSD